MPFFLIFLLVPIIEVYGFITIGEMIGALPTIGLCILAGVVGVSLIRQQGLQTFMQAQLSLRQGKMPLEQLFTGFFLIVAGILLIIPGFFTDLISFFLIFPPFRNFFIDFIKTNSLFQQKSEYYRQNDVIDAEFIRVEETDKKLDDEHNRP